jgi:glutamate synthase domain-containing protein 3
MTDGLHVRLEGEANDSVAKGISGGSMVINPSSDSTFDPSENAIIGNCALYGATGGKLFVHGLAGDRFAVRNSGALAVVEGSGLHACEYMTNGTVVILGNVARNVGAGMTGGVLYLREDQVHQVNDEYLTPLELDDESETELRSILEEYHKETGSSKAAGILDEWERHKRSFIKLLPKGVLAKRKEEKTIEEVKKESA